MFFTQPKHTLILSALLMGLTACSGGNKNQSQQNTAPTPLNTNKTYIVSTDASYAPMEYMDNNQVVGFSHDILDAAAKNQNIKLEFQNTPFEGLFAHIDKGDGDIGLASITISPDRQKQIDFSDPYFAATQMIITKESNRDSIKSFADLKTRTASVQTATSGDTILQNLQGNDSPNIKRFDTMPLAFKELESGGVDAVVGDSSVVTYYLSQNPKAKLFTLVDPSFKQEHYGFAFRKGRNDGLREAINTGLKNIKSDGTYAKIEQKWFGQATQTQQPTK